MAFTDCAVKAFFIGSAFRGLEGRTHTGEEKA